MVLINIINDQVKGEVYLVDDAMLGQLDILEDHPTYYRCITITIQPTTGFIERFNDLDINLKKSSKIQIQRNLNTPINKLFSKGEDTRRWLRVGVKVKYFFHFSIVIMT